MNGKERYTYFGLRLKLFQKLHTHNVTQKREFRGFFEGLKMAQVGYNWKGTVAPVLIE